jgi:hypothetical protein
MSDDEAVGLLTEPVIIPCVLISGGTFEFSDGVIRFIGWVDVPYIGGQTRERRICVRFAMSEVTGRVIQSALRRAYGRVSH